MPGDNDPARFWRYVAAALDPCARARRAGRAPAGARRHRRRGGGDGPGQRAGRRARPGAAGARRLPPDRGAGGPRRRSRSCWSHCRPSCGWCWPAAATRPCRWRGCAARGQLAELRAADLRFTPEEAAALLRRAGTRLPEAAVAALAARTEGWVAGLQLAALSLRGHADAGFVATFTGSHRYVLDYLTEEVLDRQPEHLVQLPAGDLGAGAALGAAVRRRHRPQRQPAMLERSSGPTCSWCRWTRSAAGGATTTCSPTCSAPACSRQQPERVLELHRPRPPGTRATGWSTTPSAMPGGRRCRLGGPAGRAGTPRRCWSAVRAPRCAAGLPALPPDVVRSRRGCAWPRRPRHHRRPPGRGRGAARPRRAGAGRRAAGGTASRRRSGRPAGWTTSLGCWHGWRRTARRRRATPTRTSSFSRAWPWPTPRTSA